MTQVNNAGAEAARQAAIAAAKAAAEAARKAAAEAAKAQAAQAHREAAQAAKALGAKDHAEEAAKPAGVFGVMDKVVGKAQDMATRAQIEKISPKEAKQNLAEIHDSLKNAKSPEDVKKASLKAAELQGRAMVSGGEHGLSKDLASDIEHLRNHADKVSVAVQKIDQLHQAMKDPHQRAAATAELLTRPQGFQAAMGDLKGLGDAPVMKDMKAGIQAIGAHADPAALAKQLQADPDLASYPPTLAKDLVGLQGSGNPAMQAGIDAVGAGLLNREGGVSYDQIKENPELGKLMANLPNSPDPAVKAKLAETAKGWANSALDANLEDKEGEDGVKDAMAGFEGNMVDLAKSTGLGPVIGQAAKDSAAENKDKLEDTANKGKSWLEKGVDAVGGFLGDLIKNPINTLNPAFVATKLGSVAAGAVGADGVASALDDANAIVGKGGDLVQQGLGKGLELTGSGLTKGFGVLGDGVNMAADLQGKALGGVAKLGAAGLDAVGADGAADGLRKGGEAVENAYDKIGDVGGDFTKGFGQGVGGTASGFGAMVKDPVGTVKGLGFMVTHPGQAAKAMWAEASKHGAAGAVGYVTANAIPMLMGGGEASMLGKLGSLGAKSSSAALRTLGEGTVNVAVKGGQAADVISSLSNPLKAPGIVGAWDKAGKAEGVADDALAAGAHAADDAAQGAKLTEKIARSVKDGFNKPLSDIAEKFREASPGGAWSDVKAIASKDGVQRLAAKFKGKDLADMSREYHRLGERLGETDLGKTLSAGQMVSGALVSPLAFFATKLGSAADDITGLGKLVTNQQAKTVVEEANKTVKQTTAEVQEDEAQAQAQETAEVTGTTPEDQQARRRTIAQASNAYLRHHDLR